MKNLVKLRDAAFYYENLVHQDEAWDFLEEYLTTNEQRLEYFDIFSKKYRNQYKPVQEKPTFGNYLGKIVKRLNDLNIQLDELPYNYQIDGRYRLNIIGIEGCNPDFTLNNDQLDKYNDIVFGILNFGRGFNVLKFTEPIVCTMEPGRYYTLNRLNKLGAAKIVLDMKHENIWKIGKHKNQENCLIQIGAPITVHRDKNSDGLRNDGIIKKGWYGINFHHNDLQHPSQTPSSIGRWSAGCTVIPNKNIHQDFMNKYVRNDYLCQQSLDTTFSYIPLDGTKIF